MTHYIEAISNNFTETEYKFLSKEQNNIHYTGHYMKYINKYNTLIDTDKRLNKMYNVMKRKNIITRELLLLVGIKLFEYNTKIYQNASQIYNHELYWNTITSNIDSNINSNINYINKLFNNKDDYDLFYNDFISKGIDHFGSGWLWIVSKNKKDINKLEITTTHDSIVFDNRNYKILGCIDLWEHSYYIDYKSERKKYLENIFKILNWHNIHIKFIN